MNVKVTPVKMEVLVWMESIVSLAHAQMDTQEHFVEQVKQFHLINVD